MTRVLKKTTITLLTVFVLLVLVILTSRFYLPAIISSVLKDQGLVVDSFVSDIPGKNSWTIQTASLRSTLGSKLEGENIVLSYHWPEILNGKLISVDIDKLRYTPNVTNDDNEKITQDSTAPTPIENFPLPSEWLKNFPVETIQIRNGQVLAVENTNIKTSLENNIKFQVDIRVDEIGLDISGDASVNNRSIQIIGQISHDNIFHFEMLPLEEDYKNENLFILDGAMHSKKITGNAMGKASLPFIKTFVTEDSPISALTGAITIPIDINLQLEDGEIISNSSLSVKGVLEHKEFFGDMAINQNLRLIGNIKSPTVSLSKGSMLSINELKNPLSNDHLEVVIDSNITIPNAVENISTFAQDFTIDNVKKILSEPAQLRFTSRNLAPHTNASSPSSEADLMLIFQENSAKITGALMIDRDVIEINTVIEIDQLSPLLLSVRPQSHLSILQNAGAEIGNEEITINLISELLLSITPENIELNETSKITAQIKDQKIELDVNGKIKPLELQLTVRSDDLTFEKISTGEILAHIDLAQSDNSINANLSIDAFGTKLRGKSAFNVETQSGEFNISIDNLINTQEFLSQWCTEITSGRVSTTGTFNIDAGLSLDAQLSVNNFAINALEFQIDNLNYQGRWQYDDGLHSKLGHMTAEQINPGILVENLDTTLSYKNKLVTLPSLNATILQGELGGKNLQWALEEDSNNIRLTLSDVDLAELVALAEYDMEISGKVKATLPVVVDSAGVQVVDGTIESLAPGGEIHVPINATAVSGPQKEAFDALRNFHYTDLSGGISGFLALNPEGLLTSKLRLEGSNPDMGRPVVLNLSVEQNTYPLFQSLSIFSQVENFGQCQN